MYDKEYDTIDLNGSKPHPSRFTAAVEETIELYVNHRLIASILASPSQLEQFGVGYLVCEGIVRDPEDIKDVRVDEHNRIFMQISDKEHFDLWFELRSSGCIGVNWEQSEDVEVTSDSHFTPEVVYSTLHHLESHIYQLTRGTHAACLINKEGGCASQAIDVGRHNAVDKVIGQALLDRLDPGEHFILSTGRQPAGMILKAARSGIPMVVTKTAPLHSGIETARRTGVCLVGFATNTGMTIFANPWRLLKTENYEIF